MPLVNKIIDEIERLDKEITDLTILIKQCHDSGRTVEERFFHMAFVMHEQRQDLMKMLGRLTRGGN